ncbi:hypothetical protein J6590_042471 [Homalodisca vitripennis]|nr:hypothetical protein J6590_042471 [Homalodisca vitripennis]
MFDTLLRSSDHSNRSIWLSTDSLLQTTDTISGFVGKLLNSYRVAAYRFRRTISTRPGSGTERLRRARRHRATLTVWASCLPLPDPRHRSLLRSTGTRSKSHLGFCGTYVTGETF